ncbi:hypothetical protein DFH05DRAFT_1459963 [Lentinula detonsa]|uniref:Uncharacterized protein n=1 Tax=Lentinula detonsa TaxID=2804962 RepID=A0A9W8TYH7_9AGAR|nr:hypothetical protein DFH05DRAFT_1459963 [Lentinula detonsa]
MLLAPLVCVPALPFPGGEDEVLDIFSRGGGGARNLKNFGENLPSLSSSTQTQRRASASNCTLLTEHEAKKLPEWHKIIEHADKLWGTGKRNIKTNDEHQPTVDHPSSVLRNPITQQKSVLQTKSRYRIKAGLGSADSRGAPTCMTENVTTDGLLSGTNGTASVSVTQGFSASSSFSLSESATIGVSQSYMTMLNFPEVASTMQDFATSVSITNYVSDYFTSSYDEMETVTLLVAVSDGHHCSVIESVTTCTIEGTGESQFIASGYIWFEYVDPVAGHYKYSVMLEDVLPDPASRSSYARFRGNTTAISRSSYQATCEEVS